MKEFFRKQKEKIITLAIGGALFMVILSILALLSGAVMKLFGFEYQSVGSIILFFLIATILSYPFGLIAGALPKALLSLNKMSKQTAGLLYVFLDTFATFWGLKITDYFMRSVSASNIAILIVALIFALMGICDIDKKKKDTEQ